MGAQPIGGAVASTPPPPGGRPLTTAAAALAAPRSSWAVSGVIAAVATAVVLWATARYGPVVGPDSVTYLSMADSAWRFGNPWGVRVVLWPPGFPVVLAFADTVLPGDGVTAGRVLNAVLAGAAILLTSVLLRRHVRPRLAILGTLLAAFAWPLLSLWIRLLSEPLFVVLVLSSVILVEIVIERDDERIALFAATTVGLATITRYLGLAVIAAVLLALAALVRPVPWRRLLLFAAVAAAPLAVWLVRNRVVAGSVLGNRGPPTGSLGEFARAAVSELSRWVLPGVAPAPLRYGVLLVVAALVGAGVTRRTAPMALVIGCYLADAALSFTRSTTDFPNTRMLAPLLPLILVLALVGAGRLVAAHPIPPALLAVVAVALVGLFAYRTHDAVADARTAPLGYTAPRWQESATAAAAATLPGPLFSNAPDVIWLVNGQPAVITPCAVYCAWDRPSSIGDVAAGRYVVWFDDPDLRPYLVPIEVLVAEVGLRVASRYDDGVIYEVIGG